MKAAPIRAKPGTVGEKTSCPEHLFGTAADVT